MNPQKTTTAAIKSDAEGASLLTLDQPATSKEAFQYFPRWVKAGTSIICNGYRLKPYAMHISAQQDKPVLSDSDLQRLLQNCLPPPTDPLDHGIGFAIVHYARDGDYLLVSRWYGGNMLKHELFQITQTPQGWQAAPLRSTNIVACVWELQVITFERQSWVCTAMARGGTEASFDSYLSMRLEGWV